MVNWQSATSLRSRSAYLRLSEPDVSLKLRYADMGRRYDKIRNLYIAQLALNWVEKSTSEATRASVKDKLTSFVEGDLERATEILSGLLEIASKDGDITVPQVNSPTVSSLQFSLPCCVKLKWLPKPPG